MDVRADAGVAHAVVVWVLGIRIARRGIRIKFVCTAVWVNSITCRLLGAWQERVGSTAHRARCQKGTAFIAARTAIGTRVWLYQARALPVNCGYNVSSRARGKGCAVCAAFAGDRRVHQVPTVNV